MLRDFQRAYTELSEEVTFMHRAPPTFPSPLPYTTTPASQLLEPPASSVQEDQPPTLQKQHGEKLTRTL